MIIHTFCTLMLLVCGIVQGITPDSNQIRAKRNSGYCSPLIILVSCLIILISSFTYDQLEQQLNPDWYILGITNCIITLVFYLIAAYSFLNLTSIDVNDVFYKSLKYLLDRGVWFFYPGVALLITLPLKFLVFDDVFSSDLISDDIMPNYFWMALNYALGALLGFMIRRFGNINEKKNVHWPMTIRIARFTLCLFLFVALGYQLLNLIEFNFYIIHRTISRFLAAFTIILICFHVLYLNVRSYDRT